MPDKTSAIYAEAFRLESEVKQLREALAAARRECEGLREFVHDAALYLESADWHLGKTRKRTPWDEGLLALVAKGRKLDAAAPVAAPVEVCICRYLPGTEYEGKCPVHPGRALAAPGEGI